MIKKLKKNRGFVILFAVTLSAILLSIALGVANIALKEVKFGTSAKDTNEAFFAADTGIECALFYDKGLTSIDPFPPTVTCNNISNISVTRDSILAFWTFKLAGLGSDNGCDIVTVDKTNDPAVNSCKSSTCIISKGYNLDDSNCASSNPNRVEREIETDY